MISIRRLNWGLIIMILAGITFWSFVGHKVFGQTPTVMAEQSRFELHGEFEPDRDLGAKGTYGKVSAVCDTGNGVMLYVSYDHVTSVPNGCAKKQQ